MALSDVLRRIKAPLNQDTFASILYNLIKNEGCHKSARIDIEPYNDLRPDLNLHFTMSIIRNMEEPIYPENVICSMLVFLYQYSIVSDIESIACLRLQPHVTLAVAKDGRYVVVYDTFNMNMVNAINSPFMNDFKYIMQPIEFVEKPCHVDTTSNVIQLEEMEKLYTYEKCDQYVCYRLMLCDDNEGGCNTSEYKRNPRVQATDKSLSRNYLSKPFLAGYYCYDVPGGVGTYNNIYGP